MNKIRLSIILSLIMVTTTLTAIPTNSAGSSGIINKIKLNNTDLPEGFIYGQIPDFAKKILINNPWEMNRTAIDKLAKSIYPNGNSINISNIHVSIIAKKNKPFGDDIVCYIIIFNETAGGKKEMEKLDSFSKVNSDRTILLSQGNISVFLIVDDTMNYHLILDMQKTIEQRLSTL